MGANLVFAIVNESTLTDAQYGGAVTDDQLREIADALECQLNAHLAPEHGGKYVVRVAASRPDVKSDDVPVVIVDRFSDPSLADVAAAYHLSDGTGKPFATAQRVDFDSILDGGQPLSEGLAHELLETAADPGANLYADRGEGNEEAFEVCDRLQGSSYKIGNVIVPDFLLRSAFARGAKGPWTYREEAEGVSIIGDQYGKTPNGYAIIRSAGSAVPDGYKDNAHGMAFVAHGRTQFGRGHVIFAHGNMTKRERRAHPLSRTFRRGVRLV